MLRLGGLINFQVVLQSKRYARTVSAGIVRDFRWAMIGRADKGLITESAGGKTLAILWRMPRAYAAQRAVVPTLETYPDTFRNEYATPRSWGTIGTQAE